MNRAESPNALQLQEALRRQLWPIVLGVVVVVSLSAPVAFLLLRLHALQQRSQKAAQQVAELLQREVRLRPVLWRYDTLKILRHLRRYRKRPGIRRIEVVDAKGLRLNRSPRPRAARDLLWGTAPILLQGRSVGRVWVGSVVWPARRQSLLLFAAFLLLGAALGLWIYLLPMRTIAKAEAHIRALLSRLGEAHDALAQLNRDLELQVEQRSEELSAAYEALQEKERHLRRLSSRMLSLQEAERRHIGRELHDSAGQALTAIRIQLQLLAAQLPDAPLPDAPHAASIAAAVDMTDHALQEIRRAVMMLGPSVLDDFGLVVALERACEDLKERTPIQLHVDLQEELPRLPAGIETACYRIVQEGLTNIARHAGASHLWLELRCEEQSLVLQLRDDGSGFDPEATTEGRGLRGVAERVALLNGDFRCEAAPGEGVTWHLRLPIHEERESPHESHT